MNSAAGGRRHIVLATITWIVLSIVGEVIALLIGPHLVEWGAMPPVASTRTDDINQVMAIFTYLSIPIFTMVIVYAGYSVMNFRSRGRPESDGINLRGHRTLQAIWVVGSIVLVSVLYVVGFQALRSVDAATPADALQVNVNGEQWLWNYSYPQYQNISGSELVLPVDRPVDFTITSTDVQHSFWIPALAVKQDAVPGETTHISVTPTQIGDYVVRCAELCGLYHAYMNTPVHVVSQVDFDQWVQDQENAQASRAPSSGGLPVALVPDMIVRRSAFQREV
jgi:cytochrome c oxidase subunit 2